MISSHFQTMADYAGSVYLSSDGAWPVADITTDVDDHIPEEFETIVSAAGPYMGVLIGLTISAVVALIITLILSFALKQVFRRKSVVKRAINRTRVPGFCIVLLAGTALSVRYAVDTDLVWQGPLFVLLNIALIISIAWWALRVVKIVEAVILSKYIGEGELGVEDRRGRRVQTQVDLIGRILAAVIITVAVAAVLLLNESVRGLGAGLLASAGVVSVVAGLAMQSTLANLFAGIQLAFTDSIRVGDVVVIEENFGTVEEITLSTVVIKSWDGRRFIYPSAHFVATPFENWTRVGTELLGVVELDVDWRVPTDALRGRLKRLLATTDLWDGQTSNLQITEATGGHVQARVVVSARNSGELWDLRCLIREDLVNFLRAEHPYAVLTQRMLMTNEEALAGGAESIATGQVNTVAADPHTILGEDPVADPVPGPSPASHDTTDRDTQFPVEEGLFTGSISAVERNREFAGPGEEAYRERKHRQND
ncbi:mechanosensitive ion channel family protein [Nesterenkonia haasae]|uniref:mechanosensitive ion channel family protein n=1 Tax=Nesterenkonia haasae TaxID=2587813 RepID=UPI001390D665|nr:mechanosensitive ion channel domain-containing protein [Nesterenkonia haasae]NDK32593.1 mechanosensitive ion channel [Nesterenkonia haasae]